MTTARWIEKSAAFSAGWLHTFGVAPAASTVCMGLSVAQHETACGDDWPNENNWGAVQHRKPNAAELAVLAGLAPSQATVAEARARIAAAVAAGTLPAPVNCALHVDSSPVTGWYWMFFWAFDTEDEGAAMFVRTIALEPASRASCKAVLESPTGTVAELAAAMYATGYYEGIHNPKTQAGKDANILDYTRALEAILPGIEAALEPTGLDLCTVVGIQTALNDLGAALDVDGDYGDLTRASVRAFQTSVRLTADGKVGPMTRGAMVTQLEAVGITATSACSIVIG